MIIFQLLWHITLSYLGWWTFYILCLVYFQTWLPSLSWFDPLAMWLIDVITDNASTARKKARVWGLQQHLRALRFALNREAHLYKQAGAWTPEREAALEQALADLNNLSE